MAQSHDSLELPTDVLFLRHGRFPGNVTMTATGEAALLVSQVPEEENYTIGLDDEGRRQARQMGAFVVRCFPQGFSARLQSDFLRVAETADVVCPNVDTLVSRKLRERDRGDVARIPKAKMQKDYPDEFAAKQASPTTWRPRNGESLLDKAADVRKLIPVMGLLAANLALPVFTSGEVVIAARAMPEFGNMDDDALRHGLPNGWPALEVDNAQFDHYTRRNPVTGVLSDTYDFMMSVRAGGETVADSGWMKIARKCTKDITPHT